MIPKTIHYVWMGGEAKPMVVKKCLASWRKHLKGYEITEWNEGNVDIGCNRYLAEAYGARKWAFVSDYVRLKAVYDHGGIYLDSDCYVMKSLDTFLRHPFFTGFENEHFPFSAVFGAESKSPVVGRFLEYYENRSFLLPDGNQDHTPNTISVSKILCDEFGCARNGRYQEIGREIVIYPEGVLCRYTSQSVVVHLMGGSWEEQLKQRFLFRMLGGRANAMLFRIRHGYLYALLELLADCRSRSTRG